MAAHSTESALEGQRRQVTVLFADMADYTATAEKLGEEATYTLMHRLIGRISETVHGHEGTIQNLTGDGVMALLPEPLGIERKLSELRAAHRALDARIEQLVQENFPDQIEMQRLKKQKLALKDVIVRLESHMLPDIIA